MDLQFIKERLLLAFQTYLGGMVDALPGLISGLVVLLVGWLIAKLIRWVIVSIGTKTLDPLAERSGVDKVVGKLGGLTLSKLIGLIAYWLVFMIFLLAASEVMGMEDVSNAVGSAFAYIPTLLTAVAIMLFGLWASEKVNAIVLQLTTTVGLSGGRVVSRALAGMIVLFAAITALNVAGVDTGLITANIQLLIGALLLAFALSYGFASREILTNMLSSFYGKERFKPGMRIRVGSDEGLIERIDSISVTMRVGDKEVLIPTSKLISERVEILEAPDEEIS